jgi:ankyrin repeat protein
LSNNKTYKKGSVFLYQVFPSDIMFYHKFLLKAVREKDYEAVFHLIEFFNAMEMNFINLKEAGTLNTALHVAAANGFYAIALLLLENYANVNQKNKSGNTPLFVAALAMHRDITKVLLEFGADVSIKNGAKHSLLTQFMSGDYRMFLDACVLRLNTIYSGCFNGNSGALKQVIDEHADNSFPLCTLRSRFIDGSTLLHKCVLYNHYAQIERLLNMVDFDGKMLNPNTRDSRGCTALHVCKNADIMRMLIEYGADVNVVNLDGNMPIHLKCLGEKHKPSQLDCVELLMFFKSELRYKNKEVGLLLIKRDLSNKFLSASLNFVAFIFKKMLPMHMAAMQGRIDVIQLLLKQEPEHSVMIALNKDLVQISLSFPYVALINDQLDCAAW